AKLSALGQDHHPSPSKMSMNQFYFAPQQWFNE
ncbi:unnamed protein product, partial [marine sediment metagenome]